MGEFFTEMTRRRELRELMKENKQKEQGERVGMQTSGIVVQTKEGALIALYMSGRRHAGENLEDLYEMRSPGLELPIQMGDAHPANWSGEKERIQAVCLAHARRRFWEIRSFYGVECDYVLERIGKVYQNEDATKGMRPEERLQHHQAHSGPIIEELREWMEREMAEKKVEPNSNLGKAIKYFAEKLSWAERVHEARRSAAGQQPGGTGIEAGDNDPEELLFL